MNPRVRFLPQAVEELGAAAEWYERRLPGLGVELVAEIDEVVAQLATSPEAWPVWRPDRPYRKRVCSRFPYAIFYVVAQSGEIEVVSVAHTRRKPGYWIGRGS